MAGEIVIRCEKCGHKLKTSSQFLGRKGHCPKCGAVIRLQRGNEGRLDGTEQQVVAVDQIETRKNALLKIQKQNDVAVVSFAISRILDQSNVQQLGEEFMALVDDYKLSKLVLNFGGVTYMSSAVMGKLVSLLKKVQGSGGQLRLCSIEKGIFEIFEIMRFDRMFTIFNTEDEAVIDLLG